MPLSLHLLFRSTTRGGMRAELVADTHTIDQLHLRRLDVDAARVPVILRTQADLLGSAVVRLEQISVTSSDGYRLGTDEAAAAFSIGAVLLLVQEEQVGQVRLDVAASPPMGGESNFFTSVLHAPEVNVTVDASTDIMGPAELSVQHLTVTLPDQQRS